MCDVEAAIGVDPIPLVAFGGPRPIVADQFSHSNVAAFVTNLKGIVERGDAAG